MSYVVLEAGDDDGIRIIDIIRIPQKDVGPVFRCIVARSEDVHIAIVVDVIQTDHVHHRGADRGHRPFGQRAAVVVERQILPFVRRRDHGVIVNNHLNHAVSVQIGQRHLHVDGVQRPDGEVRQRFAESIPTVDEIHGGRTHDLIPDHNVQNVIAIHVPHSRRAVYPRPG